MATREQLINQLSADNGSGVKVYRPLQRFVVWSVFTWVLVLAATLWVNSLRPGWEQQLLEHPRFALETLSGLITIIIMSILLFRLGTPGSNYRLLIVGAILSGGLWLGSIFYGLSVPSLEPSMAGKRDLCRYETLVYALGPFLLGMYYLNRAYVLNWTLSATVVGVTSALVPAWLMQLACIYSPRHIIEAHLGPVVVLGVFAAVLGFILHRQKNNRS